MTSTFRPFGVSILILASLAGCARETAPALTTAEMPALDTPYQLGAGDRLRITVFGETGMTGEYAITGDGNVSFPLIGNVPATGHTIEQVQQAIVTRLGAGYLKDPRVSVEVLNYRPFFILGEIAKPGQYPFSIGLTLQQAIATAGGLSYRANTHRIYLKRATDTTERLVDLSTQGQVAVLPGDTIRVSERFF